MGRKGKELTNDIKDVVRKLLNEGKTIRFVADTLGIPKSTIGDLKRRIEERGTVENIKRSGRMP